MKWKFFFICLLIISLCMPGWAKAAANNNADTITRLARQLALKPNDITVSPISGLYRITLGSQVAYVTADGHFLLRGDIIDLSNGVNLTGSRREAARLAYLAKINPADMIKFSAPHPRRSITVLTDIDCQYCRVLEHARPALNALGISVHYLAFPAGGVGSVAWRKAVDVWCAKNRRAAFIAAMHGAAPKHITCPNTAVMAGYRFGRWLGLEGTPAIITDRGRLIDGYVPPATLEKVLGLRADGSQSAHR